MVVDLTSFCSLRDDESLGDLLAISLPSQLTTSLRSAVHSSMFSGGPGKELKCYMKNSTRSFLWTVNEYLVVWVYKTEISLWWLPGQQLEDVMAINIR